MSQSVNLFLPQLFLNAGILLVTRQGQPQQGKIAQKTHSTDLQEKKETLEDRKKEIACKNLKLEILLGSQ